MARRKDGPAENRTSETGRIITNRDLAQCPNQAFAKHLAWLVQVARDVRRSDTQQRALNVLDRGETKRMQN